MIITGHSSEILRVFSHYQKAVKRYKSRRMRRGQSKENDFSLFCLMTNNRSTYFLISRSIPIFLIGFFICSLCQELAMFTHTFLLAPPFANRSYTHFSPSIVFPSPCTEIAILFLNFFSTSSHVRAGHGTISVLLHLHFLPSAYCV